MIANNHSFSQRRKYIFLYIYTQYVHKNRSTQGIFEGFCKENAKQVDIDLNTVDQHSWLNTNRLRYQCNTTNVISCYQSNNCQCVASDMVTILHSRLRVSC